MKYYILSSILFLILFISCKKEKEGSPETGSSVTVISDKSSVKNFEIVNLLVRNATVTQEQYTGTFGTNSVELIKSSDSTLSFLVPDGLTGTQNLMFSLNSQSVSLSYQVQAYTTSNTPDDILNDFKGVLQSHVDALPSGTEKNRLQDSLDVFTSSFATMTAAEKELASAIVEVNDSIFAGMIAYMDGLSGEDLSPFQRTSATLTCNYDTFSATAWCMLARHHTGVFLLVGSAGAIGIVSLFVPKLKPFFYATAAIAVLLIKQSFDDMETLMSELSAALTQGLNLRTQAAAFESGVPKAFTFQVKRANLQNKSYTVPVFNQFVSDYVLFCNYIEDKMYGLISSPQFHASSEKTFNSEKMSFISASVTGNSNVTAVISGTTSDPQLALNNIASTAQTVTVVLTYNDGYQSKSVTVNNLVVNPVPASVYYNLPDFVLITDDLGTIGCCQNLHKYYLMNLRLEVSGAQVKVNMFSAHDSLLYKQIGTCTPVCSTPGVAKVLNTASAQSSMDANSDFTINFNSTNYVAPVTVSGHVTSSQITGTVTFSGKTLSYSLLRQ